MQSDVQQMNSNNNNSVAYIARAKLPSPSANSVHVMKISEAFSELSREFCLIIPEESANRNDFKQSYEYYGVKQFGIVPVYMNLQKSLSSRYVFPLKAIHIALKKKVDYIVTRDPIVAFLAVFHHKPVVLDLHGDLKHLCGRAYRMIKLRWFVESKYLHLVTITGGLKKYYVEKYGVPKERITVLPDGYTAENFDGIEQTTPLQREKLNIGYCGSFLKGKGLGIIHQMAIVDAENDYFLYGGTKEQAEQEIQDAFSNNVTFGGYVPNSQIPKILNQMDVLLLPNQEQQVCKGEDIGKVTSPLKMFEYMASGRILVASDLLILKEVLNEKNSYLVEAGIAKPWVDTIKHIEQNRQEAAKKGIQAKKDVRQYSWNQRVEKMLKLMKEK